MKKKTATRPGSARWSPALVKRIRKTHRLSQTALAMMVGVGLNTVYLWEKGLTRPRAGAAARVAELAKASAADVKRRLRKVGLTEGMKKPGRKPKSETAKRGGRAAAARKPARKKAARRSGRRK